MISALISIRDNRRQQVQESLQDSGMGSSIHTGSSDDDDSDETSNTSQGRLVMPINEEAPIEHDPIFVRNEEREAIPESDNILMIVGKDENKNLISETKNVLIKEIDSSSGKEENAQEEQKEEIKLTIEESEKTVEDKPKECALPIEVICKEAIVDKKEESTLPIEVQCEKTIENKKEENAQEEIQNIATELIDNIMKISSKQAINDLEQEKREEISSYEKEEFIEAEEECMFYTELQNNSNDEEVKEEIQKLVENIKQSICNIEDDVPLEETETNYEKQDKVMVELFQKNDSSLNDNEEYLDAIQDEMTEEHRNFKTLSDLYIQSHFEKIVNKDDLVKIIDYDDDDVSSNEYMSSESDSDNDYAMREKLYRPKLTTGSIIYDNKTENDTLDDVDLKENYVEEEKEVDEVEEIFIDNTKEGFDLQTLKESDKKEKKNCELKKGIEITTQTEETVEQKEQQTTTSLSFTEEYYKIVANEDDTEYCSSTVLVEGIKDIRQKMKSFCEDYKDFSQKYMAGYYANYSEKKDNLKIESHSSDEEEEKETKEENSENVEQIDEVDDEDEVTDNNKFDDKDIVEVQSENESTVKEKLVKKDIVEVQKENGSTEKESLNKKKNLDVEPKDVSIAEEKLDKKDIVEVQEENKYTEKEKLEKKKVQEENESTEAEKLDKKEIVGVQPEDESTEEEKLDKKNSVEIQKENESKEKEKMDKVQEENKSTEKENLDNEDLVEVQSEDVSKERKKLDKNEIITVAETDGKTNEPQTADPPLPVIKRNVKLSLEMQLATGDN